MNQVTSSLGEKETVFRVGEFQLGTHQFKHKDAIESFTKKEANEYIGGLIQFVECVERELYKRPRVALTEKLDSPEVDSFSEEKTPQKEVSSSKKKTAKKKRKKGKTRKKKK